MAGYHQLDSSLSDLTGIPSPLHEKNPHYNNHYQIGKSYDKCLCGQSVETVYHLRPVTWAEEYGPSNTSMNMPPDHRRRSWTSQRFFFARFVATSSPRLGFYADAKIPDF